MDQTFLFPLWDVVTFENFIKFFIAYFFIIWIALLVWVVRDITNRTENIYLQICSILIILIGSPLWIFIYLLIRPWRTLFEKYYDEIDENLNTFSDIIQDKSDKLDASMICVNCWKSVHHEFHFCPDCSFELKKSCSECGKNIFKSWNTCPYCGVENKNIKWCFDIKNTAKSNNMTEKKSEEKADA